MNTTRYFKQLAACSLALALSGTAPGLLAETPKPPCQDGRGMMGGYGMGMGPGMMDGYGMGQGMMGGMGGGMMGGDGMGHGMRGAYWGSGLDLTDEQQAKVNTIQDETRKAHWAMMGEMMNQQARLRDLNMAPKRDEAAIDAAYKEFGKLHQKMYESSVAAHKRMEAVLTKEQQEKLRAYWRKGPAPDKDK